MKTRKTSTGYRQKAWDLLRAGKEFESVEAMAQHLGCSGTGLRTYLGGLEKNGYINRTASGAMQLVSDTGPRAPSFSSSTGEFRDWNIHPSMDASELADIIATTGLSLGAWLDRHGFAREGSNRLRQSLNGQRPVSEPIAAAARADRAAAQQVTLLDSPVL